MKRTMSATLGAFHAPYDSFPIPFPSHHPITSVAQNAISSIDFIANNSLAKLLSVTGVTGCVFPHSAALNRGGCWTIRAKLGIMTSYGSFSFGQTNVDDAPGTQKDRCAGIGFLSIPFV